jgi:hypothetical protein
MHGPIGDTYSRVTNFKNVGGQVSNIQSSTVVLLIYYQILTVEHRDWVLEFIRSQIKRFDEMYRGTEDAVDAETISETYISGMGGSRYTVESSGAPEHSTILGSKQKLLPISQICDNANEDVAFTSFCSRVSQTIQALSSAPTDVIAINDSHRVMCSISPMFAPHLSTVYI